jgi:predicted transcriptional regulator YdeE
MPKVNVSRSILINSSRSKVKEVLLDFKQWPTWSPWLITEPEAQVTYAEDGNQYAWDGKRIGAGEMRKGEMTNDHLSFDLTFLKPWKSTSVSSFDLVEKEGGTEVSWNMDSSLPFYMFWMKKMMQAWIGMDYERGLRMLKEHVETGKIQSKLEFKGETDYPGCTFVGIKRTVPMDQIDIAMEKDFSELITATAKADNIAGDMFSRYHKWQMVKKSVTYTAGVAVKEVPSDLPNHWMVGNLPAGKLHVVRHNGPYKHVGNAWGAVQSMMRSKDYRANKKLPPMEFYRNSPKEVRPEELVSDVCFYMK